MKHTRITFGEYDKMLAVCEKIRYDTDNSNDVKFQFTLEDNVPTIEDFKEHDVENNIDEYLPFLLYYSESYEPKECTQEEFKKSRGYIRRILYKALVLMDDEDFTPLNEMTLEKWKKKKGSDKIKIFSPIVSYYDEDEKESFIEDMKKYPFIFWKGEEKGKEELEMIFDNIKEKEE